MKTKTTTKGCRDRRRTRIHFVPPRAESKLDIFAMPEQLLPEGEALWDEAMVQIERERRDPTHNPPRDIDL